MHIDLSLQLPPWTHWALLAAAVLLLARHLLTLWRDTWAYYLAIMHLEQVEDRLEQQGMELPSAARWWAYREVLPRGLWLDWQLNLWLSLFFLDLPHHPLELVTGRLQRYVNPQTPTMDADAPRWQRLLWTARMGWWHAHRWWWELLPYRRAVADHLAREKLDEFDPPEHVKRQESKRG